MKKSRLVLLLSAVALALVLVALPILGACGGEKAADKTPETTPATKQEAHAAQPLKLGFSICMTGAAAEKGSPMGHGKLDCMKYINEELGGIEGHPIEVRGWRDNHYDAAQAATIVKKFMADGCLFFTTNSSKMMAASMEIANRAGFPGIASFSSPVCTHPPKHIYAQMPDYGDDWAAFAKYYLDNIWKGTGKPKMALHLVNNPTGSGAWDAARAGAEALGIEIIAHHHVSCG